ncbi:MAG: hypothetical protein ACK5MT_17040 [Actinomycetales bacterium]
MTAPSTPVRRDDGELIGCLMPVGDQWVPCTVFEFPLGEATSRQDAEEYLHAHGLSYLAERWEHLHESHWITVCIVEAGPQQVVLAFADYGHPQLYGTRKRLLSPNPRVLRMA